VAGVLYALFFCSGFSGLVYQVVWIRMFGNVFGNTIASASIVVAVFMLGLGVGSYVVGAWADRHATRPATILRAYGGFELAIALLALAIAALWPRLAELSALASFYSRGEEGWYALSSASHLVHGSIALVLLGPVTFLMGGTLTLLIRCRVGADLDAGGWRIAVLYAVNTAGAAVGGFLTDFALVPAFGLSGAQRTAIVLNVVAGLGALRLAARPADITGRAARSGQALGPDRVKEPTDRSPVAWTSLALALCGFAAMGMEILWFRHFVILLGEFRAVLSLLLTLILAGIAAGSLAAGALLRRARAVSPARPAQWLIVVQGLFIAASLLGLALAAAEDIRQAATGVPASRRAWQELWFNARPMLAEVALPALLMGFSFPLGNAIVQRIEQSVGRRAGLLYLSNTAGAVAGALATGFVLLPMLGIQGSATTLMLTAALAIVPLFVTADHEGSKLADHKGPRYLAMAGSIALAGIALVLWLALPPRYVIMRAQAPVTDGQRLLTLSEGVTEVIAVADQPGRGRMLLTNGHPMSSTDLLSQRYMRALAHIPLLAIDNPEDVLVLCFGVGNTAHAATLHPSVKRIEVVDLSRHVLAHSAYFRDANRDVLEDPRVSIFVNDGRHHLLMRRAVSYDVITLEPPPITHAGIGALYSREFYAQARARLKPGGYLSQWLPVAGVPPATTLAMVRAFVDVFPQSVLLSGAHTNLLLVGAKDARIEIDPDHLTAALAGAPAVHADLTRVDLGSVREIAGMFVASAGTLVRATAGSPAATDDRPIQEYGVRSLLDSGEAPPVSIVDLTQAAAWCPSCFVNGKPAPIVDGLDTYLELLSLVYQASPADVPAARGVVDREPRTIAGSAYLGAVVPESAKLHGMLGSAFAARGNAEDAIAEFREAVAMDPQDGATRSRLATILLETGQYDAAIEQFQAARRLMPGSAEVTNNLGVTLASQGRLDEAIDEFRRALALQPAFADARRNLAMALERQRLAR
jgi:spermidine synthase